MKQRTQNRKIIIHYHRDHSDYEGWGLHIWGPDLVGTEWERPVNPIDRDAFGIIWKLNLPDKAPTLNFLFHRGDEKDPNDDQRIQLHDPEHEIWISQRIAGHFLAEKDAIEAVWASQIGDFRREAKAHWLTSDSIAWEGSIPPDTEFLLHFSLEGELVTKNWEISGGNNLKLILESNRLPENLAAKYPHLAHANHIRLPNPNVNIVRHALTGQLAIFAKNLDQGFLRATGLQIPGVLDDLFPYEGPLGVTFERGIPTLRLWAPTARSVTLLLFGKSGKANKPALETHPMNKDPLTGVWQAVGNPSWINLEYQYKVEVFNQRNGIFEQNLVADPYSFCLTTNSVRSIIVDINMQDLLPDGWKDLKKPLLDHPTDISIYELHIRDFSITDPTVPEVDRGGYLAFTHQATQGMRHLKLLAEAGISHIHLLPASDFGSVNEDRTQWKSADFDHLKEHSPESPAQQEIISRYKNLDGFNWGYDPLFPLAPEGSYAGDPGSPEQILEFRQMVASLSRLGLRVVMDMVFNHIYSHDPTQESYLDKIVPGYYHRLDQTGSLMQSTCCPDTATEHSMMEKLMIDSVLHWAKAYKVDGFRFDLMGHHLLRNMTKLQDALHALNIEEDGVDGKKIFIYGEGWDFGGLAQNSRGDNASQKNVAGTGIGVFNDRIRDAVRGGGPFGGYQDPGFVFGPEHVGNSGSLEIMSQLVRLSLAGNLVDYPIHDPGGNQIRGNQLDYGGSPAGFAKEPQESIQYISAHDNETWFDAIQIKANSDLPLSERIRIHKLGISLICLAQGIPFFHAGIELLRSKSLDRNSYNSGDWFNRLDFSYQTNNWGVGLPLWEENAPHWSTQKDLLSQEDLKPETEQIRSTLTHFEEMLKIRQSSPLFRLRTASEIMNQVSFPVGSQAGDSSLIVLRIVDNPKAPIDRHYRSVLALINTAGGDHQWIMPKDLLAGPEYDLHPIQKLSTDPKISPRVLPKETGKFRIPGRTVLVFVQPA